MTIQKFKGILLFLVISVFSACQFISSEEKERQEAEKVEILGKQIFDFLKSFDSLEVQSIQTLMPSFETCKAFYYKKSQDKGYSIENYDKSIAMTIGLIKNIQRFDSTINWKSIEFRDLSYSFYYDYHSEPFSMAANINSVRITEANYIEGVLHFKSKEQNYKMEVYWKKLLGKWYLIRLRKMEEAFTY
jgi:hypothetical protein